jgi:hypothetical protein
MTRGMRLACAALTVTASLSHVANGRADDASPRDDDGTYGRLEGDVSFSIEAGPAATVGENSGADASASLLMRAGVFYLHTVGLVGQYNEGFGNDAQLLRRSAMGAVELRPFLIGRFANDLEQGPAYADLLLDSVALSLGMYRSWNRDRFCANERAAGAADAVTPCDDFGMELGLGVEMSLLPHANTPFIGLRGAMNWSMAERSAAYATPHPSGTFALTLGYHHLVALHLVDASDRLDE